MKDIKLYEKCKCGSRLWVRESISMDDGKLYLVKWCRDNHCIQPEDWKEGTKIAEIVRKI